MYSWQLIVGLFCHCLTFAIALSGFESSYRESILFDVQGLLVGHWWVRITYSDQLFVVVRPRSLAVVLDENLLTVAEDFEHRRTTLNQPTKMSITALSAPGKVLLTGGYLVLDRDYTGTVFALDARIHSVVQQMKKTRPSENAGSNGLQNLNRPLGSTEGETEAEDMIVVRSPQFVNAVWEYKIERHENGGGVSVVQKNDG